jgi:hypothetical protein
MRLEGLGLLKNPMTSSGIKSAFSNYFCEKWMIIIIFSKQPNRWTDSIEEYQDNLEKSFSPDATL